MYKGFRQICERLLRLPPDMEPPPGDQARMRLFLAAPNYYRYLFFLWLLRTVLSFLVVIVALAGPATAGAIALSHQSGRWGWLLLLIPAIALGLLAVISLFRLAVVRLEYEKRWYVVTDRSLRIREGVLTVREMTVNFANIQNIAISQGPIQRALRIADLRVETAGGGGGGRGERGQTENLHTAWFRGIDNADEVRGMIQERQRLLKDSGLGDREEAQEARFGQSSPAFVDALRHVFDEAQLLHKTVSQAAP